jgi:hypothetical protein
MNNSPELTTVLAVVAVVGTLGGVWLGRYLERGNEAMKWRRDRLLDAYSEFLRAVDIATAVSAKAFEIACDTQEHEKQRDIAFEKVAEIRRVSDRILLLSSDSVEPPFQFLTNFVASEYVWAMVSCPKTPNLDRKILNQGLSQLSARFIKSARDDLGIHPPSRAPTREIPGWVTLPTSSSENNKSWWRFWR